MRHPGGAFDTAAIIDDDLQNPPEEIPRLLARLAEGFDVVYGRPHEEQHGLWRDLASLVTKVVLQGAMGARARAGRERRSRRSARTCAGRFADYAARTFRSTCC